MAGSAFGRKDGQVIQSAAHAEKLQRLTRQWLDAASWHEYSYRSPSLGLRMIRCPRDFIALQAITRRIKPDAVGEARIARCGALIIDVSLMRPLDKEGIVIDVGIDTREHNRLELEAHPVLCYIELIEGSSVDQDAVARVRELVSTRRRLMVVLNSLHTHERVLAELASYSLWVTRGSYLVVLDTGTETMSPEPRADRPWAPRDSRWSAAQTFLEVNDRFEVDHSMHDERQITVGRDGYLRCARRAAIVRASVDSRVARFQRARVAAQPHRDSSGGRRAVRRDAMRLGVVPHGSMPPGSAGSDGTGLRFAASEARPVSER